MKDFYCDFRVQHLNLHKNWHILFLQIAKSEILCISVIYYSLAALHVSSDVFAHHQEHVNCITGSGITHYVAACCYHDTSRQRHTCVISEAVIQFTCS